MVRSIVTLCVLVLLSGCAREEQRVQEATSPAGGESTQVVTTRPPQSIIATALSVAHSSEHGPYLTDGTGRAVYLFEEDSTNQSTCYDNCSVIWPPLLAVHGAIATAADSAVRKQMIGSLTRRDGTTQVTYNGYPLYYYFRDTIPGDTWGQDVTDQFGEWYLVSPRGERAKH